MTDAIGQVLGGVLGGLLGGGGDGGGISQAAAACFGIKSTTAQAAYIAPLAGIIGTFGFIRQYELQRDALALSERGVILAERAMELAERQYNEIALPIFQRFKNYFDECVADMKVWQRRFIEKAFECDEYEAQYDEQEGRARARVSAQFDSAEKQIARSRGKYSVGHVCNQNIRLSIAKAMALSDAANRGYRFEDAKKVRLDQQCFERCQAGASVASSITGQAFNGLNGAASGTNNAVRNVQSSATTLVAQLNEAANFTTQNADFFGGLANGAFRFLGANTFQPPQTGGVIGSPSGFGTNTGGGFGVGGFGGLGGQGTNIFNNNGIFGNQQIAI